MSAKKFAVANLWQEHQNYRSNPGNIKFLRSWLVFSELPEAPTRSQTHKALGLMLAFAFSASFWTGIGWMIAAWK
jgi:hypothetical protein